MDEESASLLDVLEEESQDGRKYDTQIEINGTFFHKSTILKQTFIGTKVSKDRLRRVRGMSKYTSPKANDNLNLDDILLQGDAVLFLDPKNIPKLGAVVHMKKAGRKVKLLKGDEIKSDNVYLTLRQLALEDTGENYQWSGSYSCDPVVQITGNKWNNLFI